MLDSLSFRDFFSFFLALAAMRAGTIGLNWVCEAGTNPIKANPFSIGFNDVGRKIGFDREIRRFSSPFWIEKKHRAKSNAVPNRLRRFGDNSRVWLVVCIFRCQRTTRRAPSAGGPGSYNA